MKKVIINEQHSLLPEQKRILDERFPNDWEYLKAPAKGWQLEEIVQILQKTGYNTDFVFVSPVPAFMVLAASFRYRIYAFHNDKREKNEVGGKIIHIPAKDGWTLVG